ncbi:hypothetical protein ES703_111195 [subsurface metagenome]
MASGKEFQDLARRINSHRLKTPCPIRSGKDEVKLGYHIKGGADIRKVSPDSVGKRYKHPLNLLAFFITKTTQSVVRGNGLERLNKNGRSAA